MADCRIGKIFVKKRKKMKSMLSVLGERGKGISNE